MVSHAVQEESIHLSRIPFADGGSFECSISPSKYSSVVVAMKTKEQMGGGEDR